MHFMFTGMKENWRIRKWSHKALHFLMPPYNRKQWKEFITCFFIVNNPNLALRIIGWSAVLLEEEKHFCSQPMTSHYFTYWISPLAFIIFPSLQTDKRQSHFPVNNNSLCGSFKSCSSDLLSSRERHMYWLEVRVQAEIRVGPLSGGSRGAEIQSQEVSKMNSPRLESKLGLCPRGNGSYWSVSGKEGRYSYLCF